VKSRSVMNAGSLERFDDVILTRHGQSREPLAATPCRAIELDQRPVELRFLVSPHATEEPVSEVHDAGVACAWRIVGRNDAIGERTEVCGLLRREHAELHGLAARGRLVRRGGVGEREWPDRGKPRRAGCAAKRRHELASSRLGVVARLSVRFCRGIMVRPSRRAG